MTKNEVFYLLMCLFYAFLCVRVLYNNNNNNNNKK